jgi:hypothetical protein
MSTPAKVHSSDSIEAIKMAMVMFVEQVRDALAELSAEMRRMQDWVEHDRPRYWKLQLRRGTDLVHEATQALHRCLMFPLADERPSCTEERIALKRAKERLAYCERKEDRVRHWQKTLRHETFEYEGRMSQLLRLVEVDVPRAIGVLNRILRNLEEYHAVRAANPRAAYDDIAMAKAIFDELAAEEGGADADQQAADVQPVAASGNNRGSAGGSPQENGVAPPTST